MANPFSEESNICRMWFTGHSTTFRNKHCNVSTIENIVGVICFA
jgi:hypothetical protein